MSDSEIILPDINTLASKYREFMQRVMEITQSDLPQEMLSGPDSALYVPAYHYAENAKGANTEEPQREVRNTTLKEYLLG